jgi:hypothetical protein
MTVSRKPAPVNNRFLLDMRKSVPEEYETILIEKVLTTETLKHGALSFSVSPRPRLL